MSLIPSACSYGYLVRAIPSKGHTTDRITIPAKYIKDIKAKYINPDYEDSQRNFEYLDDSVFILYHNLNNSPKYNNSENLVIGVGLVALHPNQFVRDYLSMSLYGDVLIVKTKDGPESEIVNDWDLNEYLRLYIPNPSSYRCQESTSSDSEGDPNDTLDTFVYKDFSESGQEKLRRMLHGKNASVRPYKVTEIPEDNDEEDDGYNIDTKILDAQDILEEILKKNCDIDHLYSSQQFYSNLLCKWFELYDTDKITELSLLRRIQGAIKDAKEEFQQT